jgi:hypothetical protein
MTEQFETQVREALRLRAFEIPNEAAARLRSVEYDPRGARWSNPIAFGAGAGVAATVATVVSLVVLGSSQPAFAGWSPTPTAASGGQIAAAEAACQARLANVPSASAAIPPATAGQDLTPVLTDVRGPYTVAIYSSGSSSTTCFTGPSFTVVSSRSSSAGGQRQSGSISAGGVAASGGAGGAAGGVAATSTQAGGAAFSIGPAGGNGTTPADELQVSGAHFTLPDGSVYTLIDGQAGSSVIGATLLLDNGQQIEATTANGWFEAWWPGTPTAVSAQVTTATGTLTEQLPAWTAPPQGGTSECTPSSQAPCSDSQSSSSGG